MFGLRTFKDPFGDAKSAERWLASLPDNDPLAVHREVLAQLGRVSEPSAKRTPSALEALFHVDAATKALRATLTGQYIEHATRSSRIESQLWQALFDLAQGFLGCYAAFAREVMAHGQSSRWQGLQPELIARQIMQLGLDAKTRLFRYEQWIPAKWIELHNHFMLACSARIERVPLAFDPGGATTTIEHEYLVVLVLHLVNAGNFTPKQLEWVTSELDEWCQFLRFALEPSSIASFYVDLGSRTGLRRRAPVPLEGHVLFLDTRPLHALLMQNSAVLEHKIKANPVSEKTARRTEQLALVTRLASQIDPDFKPFVRRGERTSAGGTVDAIVGFGKIAAYLGQEERSPIGSLDPLLSFGGTMELAVFGRARNDADRHLEQAQRRLAAYAAPGGPWEVKDVSQTGFRLLAPMSVANEVRLGTLAALRPHGQRTWALGIVRRMKRLTSDRAEIGLQIIANTLSGVELIEDRKTTDSDYSIDGEATTIDGRTFASLYLSLRKRDNDPAVQSLIVPAVEYQPAKRFKLQTARRAYAIRLGRLLEQQPDWVWTAVEPLETPGAGG